MEYTYGIQYTILNADDPTEKAVFNLPAEPTGTLEAARELYDQYLEFFSGYGEEGVNWENMTMVRAPLIVWEPFVDEARRAK